MDKRDDKPEEEIVDEKVLEILRESLKQQLKKERKGSDSKEDNKKALKSVLQEFLSCGKLFGYDLDGNVVEIYFVNNKMEESAMQNLFVQKFGEYMAGKINIRDDF